MSKNNHCMTVRELYAALEARIPAALSCPWDHDGLSCCPDPDAPVRGVLVALDITEEVIELAATCDCNVILAHHPILFDGLHAVTRDTADGRKVMRLLAAGISTMAFHTRLDALVGGVNDILAARLGLTDTVPFEDGESGSAASAPAPMGRVGTLPRPMSLEDFAAAVKTALAIPGILGGTHTEHLEPVAPAVTYVGCGKEVRRVAVLGGAGDDFIAAAAAAGADTYLTGEIDHHKLCDAPDGSINLVAAGHYFTEFPVCSFLADTVASICPDVPVHVMGGTRVRWI